MGASLQYLDPCGLVLCNFSNFLSKYLEPKSFRMGLVNQMGWSPRVVHLKSPQEDRLLLPNYQSWIKIVDKDKESCIVHARKFL